MSEFDSKLAGLRIERGDETQPPRRGWLAAILIGLVLLAAGLWWGLRPTGLKVTVTTARAVAVGGTQTVLNASGYVTARRQATVSSKVTGKVQEVLIEEGMEVAEGQVLARLDDANIQVAIALAGAQLAASKADLEEMRVRLQEARLDLERAERLVESRIASQADLDRARAAADSWAARLESGREAVKVAEQGLAVARQALTDTVIRAPFAGIVVAKNAQPGEMISPMSAGGSFTRTGIGTVVDMNSLEIEVDVNEAYIQRVVAGQQVEATLDAYPDWKIPASVIAIIPTADRSTATVQVRIGFDALDPRVLPDMGVKVAFRSESSAESQATAVSIARQALTVRQGATVVFVAAGDRAERRAVRLGPESGDQATILAGLAAGERVLLDPPAELVDGDPIRILEE